MSMKNFGHSTRQIITLVVALFAVAVISSRFYFRWDVTGDSAYTLSEGSLNIAAKLDRPVAAKLYFSKSLKDMPPMIKQYGERIEDVLLEYAAASQGKISVAVIDPRPYTDDEEWALKYGVQGIPTGNGDNLYLGVVFIAGSKEVAIPYLDPRKEEFLEYDLAETLLKLKTADKPKLGLMSEIPINGDSRMEKWAIMQSLENSFEVVTVAKDAGQIPKDVKVLFLIHPKDLADKTLYAIDQFVMAGGRLMVAVDPFSRVDAALSQQGGAMIMNNQRSAGSNLQKLFNAWDIEFTAGQVVGDLARGTTINAGQERINYPLFMTLMEEDINDKHKITSQLRQILYAEGGGFSLKKDSPNKMTALVSTTPEAGEAAAAMLQFQQPGDVARTFRAGKKSFALAALVSGKFKSAFGGNPPSDAAKGPALKEAQEDGLVFVIGDVDFMHDGNAVNKMRFGPQVIMTPRNDNLNIVINAAEYLGGNQDLISIRSSGQIARPFTKVMEIQKNAQAKWQAEEERLSKELQDLQQKLGQLQRQRTDGNRFQLNASQQAEIDKFRAQERAIRKRRREVRKNLREDIEKLGHQLVLANLLIAPTLVSGFGVMAFRRRSRREKEEKTHG